MKISTQTRYAVRLMLELSLKRAEGIDRMTAKDIAQCQGISEKYLEAIATKLCRAGLISSMKGVGGGYSIAHDPKEVSIGDIMRLMETTYFERHCVKDADKCCPMYDGCILSDFWQVLEGAITNVVDNVSIADVAKQHMARTQESVV